MKKDKVIYWTTTVIVAAVMLGSAYYFAFGNNVKDAFTHLGLPNYFRIELSIAKVLGALAILIPGVPARIKEFAYAGLAIVLVSAIIAHASSGDGIASLDPLFFLSMLVVSYLYYYKRYVTVKHG